MPNGFPTGHVWIGDDGGDFTLYLDTTNLDDDGECPVVMYGPGANGQQVALNFFDFIERLRTQDWT